MKDSSICAVQEQAGAIVVNRSDDVLGFLPPFSFPYCILVISALG